MQRYLAIVACRPVYYYASRQYYSGSYILTSPENHRQSIAIICVAYTVRLPMLGNSVAEDRG